MSNKDYDFNIDDILAEFYAQESREKQEPQAPVQPPRQNSPVPIRESVLPQTEPRQETAPLFPAVFPVEQEEAPLIQAPPVVPERPLYRQEPSVPRRAAPPRPEPAEGTEGKGMQKNCPEPLKRRSQVPDRAEPVPVPKRKAEPEADEPRRPSIFIAILRNFFGLIFGALSLLVLAWMLVNTHPDSGSVSVSAAKTPMNLIPRIDSYVNNAASDALSDLTYIRKIYTIPENATVAPVPNPARYGSTTDPWEVMEVIESASILLDGQEVAFDPNAEFERGSEIRYYFDETILAITWKENISGRLCSCAEIKVADGSQLRRKLSGDSYGSSIQLYATDMAKAANAVVAINGDFYAFRPIGITAYQRQVYRCNSPTLDTCFFTASGDMLLSYAGEHTDWDETQEFINDNDVLFAVTFGPILVDNGELREVKSYPIGEIHSTHSRTAIGMLDDLHYILMTVNYGMGFNTAVTLAQSAQFIYDKGVTKAYALDGGQTSVLIMDGSLVNYVDFGYQRTMSDIIYFATALPEQEWAS